MKNSPDSRNDRSGLRGIPKLPRIRASRRWTRSWILIRGWMEVAEVQHGAKGQCKSSRGKICKQVSHGASPHERWVDNLRNRHRGNGLVGRTSFRTNPLQSPATLEHGSGLPQI